METLKHFKDFIDELSLNNSRNYKLDILSKYKDDEDIRYYLNYLYNNYITTGISDKKLYKELGLFDYFNTSFDNVKDMLEYIKNNNTGSDKVIAEIQSFKTLQFVSDEEHKEEANEIELLFDKIVTKNLPLGIDTKSINKAMGNIIPEFNVMLANKYFEHPDLKGKEFAITTKIDGGRIIALKENGEAKFYTRQGQEYEGLVDLKNEMEKYMPDNTCLDGELTLLDKGNLESGDQYKATMKLSRTKDKDKHGLKMLVFDCMTAEEFKNQESHKTYSERRANLKVIENMHNFTFFSFLPILYQGTDTSKIDELLKEQVRKGEEGIMINICDAYYEFKRTSSLLKVKLFNDTEVVVKGFEAGTNKHSNTLGALICDYKGYELGVGSGFSDEERDYIWTHQDEYLGKQVVVKYFEETYNAQGGLSLRFPIFKGLRLS